MKKCQLHTSRIIGLRVAFPDPSPEKYNNNVIKLLDSFQSTSSIFQRKMVDGTCSSRQSLQLLFCYKADFGG